MDQFQLRHLLPKHLLNSAQKWVKFTYSRTQAIEVTLCCRGQRADKCNRFYLCPTWEPSLCFKSRTLMFAVPRLLALMTCLTRIPLLPSTWLRSGGNGFIMCPKSFTCPFTSLWCSLTVSKCVYVWEYIHWPTLQQPGESSLFVNLCKLQYYLEHSFLFKCYQLTIPEKFWLQSPYTFDWTTKPAQIQYESGLHSSSFWSTGETHFSVKEAYASSALRVSTHCNNKVRSSSDHSRVCHQLKQRIRGLDLHLWT